MTRTAATISDIVSAVRFREILQARHRDHFMAIADLFAMGCLLHFQGQERTGRKLVKEALRFAASAADETYLRLVRENLSGNELRFAREVHAHQEVNELLEQAARRNAE